MGVFYDSQEQVEGIIRRYPQTKFPPARILVNPEIISVSAEMQQFSHGCLSIPCPNRCELKSPKEIVISYQDPIQNRVRVQDKFKDIDAVVLWHELTHILEGKTYMDVTLASLSLEDLNRLQEILAKELQNRNAPTYSHLPNLNIPPFHFTVKINPTGTPELDQQELTKVLFKMTDETVLGLFNLASKLINNRA